MIRRLMTVSLLVALVLTALPLTSSRAQDDDAPAFTLTVLHTNDVHAHYDTAPQQATLVAEIRAEADHVLLLDGGDRFTGSIFHSYHQGRDSALVMNLLGYDAMVLGSYEFTHGPDVLANFINLLNFPVVAANVDFEGSDALAGMVDPYDLFTFDGETVAVIGVTQGDSRVRPIPELVFSTDYVGVLQPILDELAGDGVNKVVLLSHLGYFNDLDLATRLDGVDIIVGADSETLLSNTLEDAEGPYPTLIDSLSGETVLVVQAGDRGEVLGRLDVGFDADGVAVTWGGDAQPLEDDALAPDEAMTALIDELRAPVEIFLGQEVGESAVRLIGEEEVCRFEQCSMGSLIADALRFGTGAQIGLQNGGGIRASIEAGPVTVGDVLAVLPFNNTYVIFDLGGEELIAALENSVSRVEVGEGTGRFLQVSGLRFAWNGTRPAGQRIVNVEVLNEDGEYEVLDVDEVYSVAMNDYMFAGADDYAMFVEDSRNVYDFGRPLDELVRTYISEVSPVTLAEDDERIIRLDR